MTEQTKHTPGPWEATPPDIRTGKKTWWVESRPGMICRCLDGPDDAGRANACLVAAAPDMLEVCKKAIDFYEGNSRTDDDGYGVYLLAQIAIAKAEGCS